MAAPGQKARLTARQCQLTHDEARRIAADGTCAWTSTQIDRVLVRIAFAEAQHRTEKATAEPDEQF